MKRAIVLVLCFFAVSANAGPPVRDVHVTNDASDPVSVVVVGDYVKARMTGEFPSGNAGCCLVDPDTTFIPRLDVGQFDGHDLLIEYVSCQALIPTDQSINLFIGENGQDAPRDTLIAIELSEQNRALADDSLSGTAWHASHPVKVIVDSAADLLLVGRRLVGSLGVGRVSCVIAGRLVN